MRWAVNLYTTEKTKKKLPVIMQKIRKGKLQPGIWLITIASNEQNLLDLFHSACYLQPVFQRMNPEIVGIAQDEEAARELVLEIIKDVYEKQGNFDVRTYFEFQE